MNDDTRPPLVSVVVPAYNAGEDLELCLSGLRDSNWPRLEIFVADDASKDGSAEAACARHNATHIRLDENSGPANARNRGVECTRGKIIMFIDSDVVVHPDAIRLAVESLTGEASVAAVFGSYDDAPAHPSFLSQYRNLYHHWVHQHGGREASTFWTGCGAVRRDAFEAVGGFATDIPVPAMEDIELGYRLVDAGYRISLRKDMLCTHLKQWTLLSLVKTDIFQRGVPWVVLMLRHQGRKRDLNLNNKARIATVSAALFFVAVVFSVFAPWLLWLAAACVVVIVWMQIGFYRYTAGLRGTGFALLVVPAQVVFFGCCAVSIPLGMGKFLLTRNS